MQTIYTIGHSTHPIEEFIVMLAARGIVQLVDIRTVPKSRHNPQFKQDALEESLRGAGISYRYMRNLGGFRPAAGAAANPARKSMANAGWRNRSFRNYADYMQTPEFREAVETLIRAADGVRTVIMCAEAVPWRCHRSLVGDALLVRGVRVVDIMSRTAEKEHKLTPFAVVSGKDITYPATEE